MKLHPFYEIAGEVDKLIGQGHTIYQQFNCAACGTKQSMDVPNVLYTRGHCEECGHTTDIRRDGCNFMLHMRF